MKPAGKPDAGNRHVRFDERGWETGRWPKAQATAPILDSTFTSFRLAELQEKPCHVLDEHRRAAGARDDVLKVKGGGCVPEEEQHVRLVGVLNGSNFP